MISCEAKVIVYESTETSELLWTTTIALEHDQTMWVVGRSSDCNIVINNRYISRKHCTIVKVTNVFGDIVFGIVDGLLGEQDGSKYGIWKNGSKVVSAILKHNDIIQIAPNIYLKFDYVCSTIEKDTDPDNETNY